MQMFGRSLSSANGNVDPDQSQRGILRMQWSLLPSNDAVMAKLQRPFMPLLCLATTLLLASCTTSQKAPHSADVKNAEPQPKTEKEKIHYHAKYDAELTAIFELAKQGEWEQAEAAAAALQAQAPNDDSIARVHNWVRKQRQMIRDKAVEDKIREVDAKKSVFNPSLKTLITEKKDRGLPPRKDVRDAIEQFEATPYIPDTYGKVIEKKGLMYETESQEGRMAKILEKEISIHLDNVTLEAILLNVSQSAGINFVADKALPALQQNLSVNMDKVNLSEFLRYVSRNFEIQFQVGEDLVWIVDGKDPKKLLEETRFYRLRKGFVMPAAFGPSEVNRVAVTANNVTTVTENQKINKFVNDGAPTSPSIEAAIKQFFTGSKFLIDYERNLIVARGTREQLEIMEKIIEEFDRPIQQVLIEARFITVSQAAFLQLGATWETGRADLGACFERFHRSRNRRRAGIARDVHQYSRAPQSHRHFDRAGTKRRKPHPQRAADHVDQQSSRHHQRWQSAVLL
jgi:type IV pilus assembly protein PilQ